MIMITRKRLGEIADELSEGFRHGNLGVMHDAVTAVVDELRAASVEPERKPYVPAANYVGNGGARMADAIEGLSDALNDVKIDLDAHRAALVAAGWLDVNGEPVMKHDQH